MEEAKKVALEEEDERCEMDGHIFSIGTWEMFGDVGVEPMGHAQDLNKVQVLPEW